MKFYTNAIESGDQILLRGYENGRAFSRKVKYEPTLYVPPGPSLKGTPTKWKNMHGLPLAEMPFSTMREARDFIKSYENVPNFKIYGMPRFTYAYINEEYPGDVEYDPELISVANIDIECESENGFPSPDTASEAITAITLKKRGIFHVFGCGRFTTSRQDIKYNKCRDEKEILERFLHAWSEGGYPDVVTGWNINFFDIPYLVRRIGSVLGENYAKKLSPWGFFTTRSVTILGREQTSIAMAGISSLDYIEMYRKFTYKQQESYKLDNIAFVELEERKLDYTEFDSLHDLYKKDYQKFIEYNIRDVELVDKLEDKMKLIELVYALAYDAKVNFNDTFAQVRMWDVLTHNHLYKKNIAVPTNVTPGHKSETYEGAYVKEVLTGLHKWVVSFDLDGLYPHLMMMYNISPETLLGTGLMPSLTDLLDRSFKPNTQAGYSYAANGCLFRNDIQGFLPEMMEICYDSRKEYKRMMIDAKKEYEAETNPIRKKELGKKVSKYKNLQMAKKIQGNSAYGAIGNPYFRYYDLRQATAITLGGQLSIRWVGEEVNAFMNKVMLTSGVDYIIASDTDSIYVNFGPLIEAIMPNEKDPQKIVDYIDKIVKAKFDKVIDASFRKLTERMGARMHKMSMKRECIAETGIWTAKKRYILNVWDEEGVRYKEPQLKISGIEAVKSSTPSSCRAAIKEALKIIMKGDECAVQSFNEDFRAKFKTLPFEEVAFPRGTQGMDDYALGSKSIPIHVRGALSFNDLIVQHKLSKRYAPIRDGDKLKFCYLRMPNTSGQNIIASTGPLPKEFNLDKMIDYDLQFEKAYTQPLKAILDVIGWKNEKGSSLEDFFA